MNNKQIIVDAVFGADGALDVNATIAEATRLTHALNERITSDHDTVSVGITKFLLDNPGLKTVSTSALVRALHGARAAAGEFNSDFDKSEEAYDRLMEVVPAYIRANPDMFFVGKKSGVVIRYVPTEQEKDDKGVLKFDDKGNPVARFRHTDEEWTKITAKRAKGDAEETEEKTPESKAA